MRVAMAVFLCLFAVGLCRADDNPSDITVWSQLPRLDQSSGYASQQAVDVPWFSECANDFEPQFSAEITHVHWWGDYWSVPGRDGLPENTISIQQVGWDGRPIERAALDCTGSQRITCGADSITGTTVGGVNNVTYYSCSSWVESGPEDVYQLIIPYPNTHVEVALEQYTLDLDVFLLSDCDENTCLTYGSLGLNYTFAEPGTYYLVVDGYGYGGTAGPYALWINCDGVSVPYYCIRFYDDTGGPSRSGPGSVLYEYWTEDAHEDYIADPGIYSYWADIPPFPVSPGQVYWVSFQQVSKRFETGQWGWCESLPVQMSSPWMDFEYLSVPRWTYFPDAPIYNSTSDLAFELFADETPVERSSWGLIKGMYR